MKYYEISESAAADAKRANSFSDYVPGSATTNYRVMVDGAAAIAERQKQRVDPMYHGKIDALLDSYARRLAENINSRNAIDARVPSVLISGGSNFPVAKKEQQNAARVRNMEDYNEVQGILQRIKSVGTGGIMSDDKNAIAKLEKKLEALEGMQEKMKFLNAYYRKHGSLKGCPGLSPEETKERTARGFGGYPAWALTNNNANIRRIRERIATLKKEAQRAEENTDAAPFEGNGYKLVENAYIGRIQLIFDDKPDEEIRAELKSWGFRWSPSQGAWQRMLNDNGRCAAKMIMKKLDEQLVSRF